MKIEYDDELNEHYLKFLDSDDRGKKSRFLKRILEAGQDMVTMSIQENGKKPTRSQVNLYRAFTILLADYTGYSVSDIKASIFNELGINRDDIMEYNRDQFSEFIERLFQYCSNNVGIEVQIIDGKLTNMNEKV